MKKGIVFLSCLIFLLGCSGEPKKENNNVTEEQNKESVKESQKEGYYNDGKFIIEEEPVIDDSESFLTYITGTVENISSKDYGYVHVSITLYDEDGALVGSTLDNVNNLKSGKKWKFKAMATEDFASFEVDEITAY